MPQQSISERILNNMTRNGQSRSEIPRQPMSNIVIRKNYAEDCIVVGCQANVQTFDYRMFMISPQEDQKHDERWIFTLGMEMEFFRAIKQPLICQHHFDQSFLYGKRHLSVIPKESVPAKVHFKYFQYPEIIVTGGVKSSFVDALLAGTSTCKNVTFEVPKVVVPQPQQPVSNQSSRSKVPTQPVMPRRIARAPSPQPAPDYAFEEYCIVSEDDPAGTAGVEEVVEETVLMDHIAPENFYVVQEDGTITDAHLAYVDLSDDAEHEQTIPEPMPAAASSQSMKRKREAAATMAEPKNDIEEAIGASVLVLNNDHETNQQVAHVYSLQVSDDPGAEGGEEWVVGDSEAEECYEEEEHLEQTEDDEEVVEIEEVNGQQRKKLCVLKKQLDENDDQAPTRRYKFDFSRTPFAGPTILIE